MADPHTPKVWNKRDPNVPKDAVYVGRPTKWGNPFAMKSERDREAVVSAHRDWLLRDLHIQRELRAAIRSELRGKHLVCWCAPKACHADLLLEIANG